MANRWWLLWCSGSFSGALELLLLEDPLKLLSVNFLPLLLPLAFADVDGDAKLLVGDVKLPGLSAGSALLPVSVRPST